MNKQVTIYIPSNIGGKFVDEERQAKIADEVANSLTEFNGGATMTEHIGYYKANNGQIIKEKIITVASSYDENYHLAITEIIEDALFAVHSMWQESVMVQYQDIKTEFYERKNGEFVTQ